eukprot:CAMPEP_0113491216 /NCGR_PEP_ID=MMETSP0014_2-20120614/27444_1 /TAXON_ID=2857 /ORGANISM="Nitzschia sp." /LENGTH=282 /DNA_ID=CAMNT_0000385005 /DNA_START=111 /DNA_END=959 /DNA_ORIENTATION=- /assembly_acc=CAM_ASM_000159
MAKSSKDDKKDEDNDDAVLVDDGSNDNETSQQSKSSDGKKTMLRVAVGTTNPCKIDSVKIALSKALATASPDRLVELQVEGFKVESDVPDQPFGDEQTQMGAKNRAANAHRAFRKKHSVFPHLSVGLEGGLEWSSTIVVDSSDDKKGNDKDDEQTLWCMAWMSVYGRRNASSVDLLASNDSKYYIGDKKPIHSLAKTGSFLVPHSVDKLIRDGMELGDADDKIFKRVNSKQGQGTVGYLTNGIIDRSTYYEHAITLALVPWIRPDVYGSDDTGFVGGMCNIM